MSNRRCLYPGSFDPVTNGHMDVIERACRMFDEVYVGVLHNPAKVGSFPVAQRINLIEAVCEGLPQVRVLAFDGLMVELAKQLDIHIVIRGVRGVTDMESEMSMARANRMLYPALETVFLPATPQMEAVSASLVRQIASFGGDISAFVPPKIVQTVMERFHSGTTT